MEERGERERQKTRGDFSPDAGEGEAHLFVKVDQSLQLEMHLDAGPHGRHGAASRDPPLPSHHIDSDIMETHDNNIPIDIEN